MNRRSFLKTTALGLGSLPVITRHARPEIQRPNIIWIMADDLGYGDPGCYGCTDIPTPHIDSIARNGVKCHSFYAAAPVCTPSRAALLTGRYPEAVGMTRVLMGTGGLEARIVTIAEVLRNAGYTTGLIGKWHLGYDQMSLPNNQGFDLFYGHRGGKIDFWQHTDSAQKIAGNPLGKHDFYENETEIFPEGYATDLFTRRALRFVEEHRQRPFFLFLAYNAPHYARKDVLQAPEASIRKFSQTEPTRRELYQAMVNYMDDGIGQLLACLKQHRLDQNTLVIFLSDNGADPGHGGSNQPLSGGKWNYKEGGIRVPMVIQWPGVLPARSSRTEPIHMIDLFPTTLAAAGISKPPDLELDGLNVLKVLQGNSGMPERPLFFNQKQVVRLGQWKLLGSELYDLDTDLQESRNLAVMYPEIVKLLAGLRG